MIVRLAGMAGNFGRWQSKDQPSATDIDEIEAEHIFEEGAIGFGIFAVDNYVCSVNQAVSPLRREFLASLYQQQIAQAKQVHSQLQNRER
jgi:hypothetical protein